MDGGSVEPSLAEIHQEMSELLDKLVNAQKEKTSWVHVSSRKPTKKCAMKMKVELEKKQCARKNVIHGRKPFIRPNKKSVKPICTSCWETIVDTMKVLFV